jgi:hypothetical protein
VFGFEGPCEECGFDPSSVSAEELPAAMADVGRRFRVPLTRGLKGEDLDALLRAHPIDGLWSALSYACHVRDVMRVFRERTERMLTEDAPDLGWWDHEASPVEDRYDEQDPEEVAAAIETNADAYGKTLSEVSGSEWDRTGTRRSGEEFTVLTKAQYALHEANHHLLDVGRVLRAARGR